MKMRSTLVYLLLISSLLFSYCGRKSNLDLHELKGINSCDLFAVIDVPSCIGCLDLLPHEIEFLVLNGYCVNLVSPRAKYLNIVDLVDSNLRTDIYNINMDLKSNEDKIYFIDLGTSNVVKSVPIIKYIQNPRLYFDN